MKIQMTPERLEEIEDKHLLHGAEEWTNEEDVETEAAIKELIAAYKTSQQALAGAQEEARSWHKSWLDTDEKRLQEKRKSKDLRAHLAAIFEERDDIQADNLKALELIIEGQTSEVELMIQLSKAQAELKRLEDLYNTDRQAYLDDITLLQTEVGRLRFLLEEYRRVNETLVDTVS